MKRARTMAAGSSGARMPASSAAAGRACASARPRPRGPIGPTVQGGRGREVPRHVRRAEGGQGAAWQGHADRHDPRPRRRRRALDQLSRALGVRRQGVRQGRQGHPELAGNLEAVGMVQGTTRYFIHGTTAWLDPDNNQAFLSGKCSATVNVNTIYLSPRARRRPTRRRKRSREHGPWALAQGSGRALRQLQHQRLAALRLKPARIPPGRSTSCAPGTARAFLPKWTKTGQSISSRPSPASTRKTWAEIRS